MNPKERRKKKQVNLSRYFTPSFFIGAAAAAIIAAGSSLSVYNGDFETATFASVATVVGTAVVRALGIYLAEKFGAGS